MAARAVLAAGAVRRRPLRPMATAAVVRTPAATAAANSSGLPKCPAAKTPPYETVKMLQKFMVRAPVTAPPAMEAGITRRGAASANGMALSGTKAGPNSQAALP
ncbi:hypothetical protein [Streptomyces europaeiscabiei]|uniref:hypothetical protein n=2 Tax=Streptomyces europaeiscabiei TaxID=146819 RepID=UPI00131B1CC2|nr:hypothetical protein [Streptomyces europaeiscabiei]MDX2762666.1 hypothetical protein [Streptomyces europaeiscabiei]MDX2770847.1 hypothetical protein [Streptomyces europaeiscabiei]MDX3664929.1 hypothetical protein [Streptomyces europaeiscabiei]